MHNILPYFTLSEWNMIINTISLFIRLHHIKGNYFSVYHFYTYKNIHFYYAFVNIVKKYNHFRNNIIHFTLDSLKLNKSDYHEIHGELVGYNFCPKFRDVTLSPR